MGASNNAQSGRQKHNKLTPCTQRQDNTPPLHIKLGLIKQLGKALDKDGECFKYICRSFPGLSIEKLKAGIFDGPDIRKLMQDENFILSMNPLEADAWRGFVGVVQNFLGNRRAANFEEVIQNMLDVYQRLGANKYQSALLG